MSDLVGNLVNRFSRVTVYQGGKPEASEWCELFMTTVLCLLMCHCVHISISDKINSAVSSELQHEKANLWGF